MTTILTTLGIILAVALALFLLGVGIVVIASLVEAWWKDRQRTNLLGQRLASEARIQAATGQVTSQMLMVAREELLRQATAPRTGSGSHAGSGTGSVIRAEQVWDEDDHG